MDVNNYIIESCRIQGATTSEDFIGFARAYQYCIDRIWLRSGWAVLMDDMPPLITLVLNNPTWVDFRNLPVTFADGSMSTFNSHETIKRAVKMLIQAANDNLVDADSFYQQFEEIHPWRDGNGRVGSLLWNVLSRNILDPIHPSEFRK